MSKSLSLILCAFFLFPIISLKAEGGNKNKSAVLFKTNGDSTYTRFNINNISTYIYSNGASDCDPRFASSGLFYPKGSNKTAVFRTGAVWGGKIKGEIRTGGSAYTSGLKPGRILPGGRPQDPNDPSARIFRVRPDYKTADLSSEVNDGEGSSEQVRARYEKDWNEWPAGYGAPYKDVNGDGKYEPSVDIPGVPGAGQTIWFVANDFDSVKSKYLFGSTSMGIEVQVTVWGYNSSSPLNDVMFRKYKLIEKGDNYINDMYFGMFSDVDDGSAEDDVCGCDSTLQIGFIYNFTDNDYIYGRYTPAVGFAFMQGPAVPGNPSDSALIDGAYVKGKKNLPMTSFYNYIKSWPGRSDPPGRIYEGSLVLYSNFQGESHFDTGEPLEVPDQFGGGVTKFPVSGDPVSGSGWLDGYPYAGGKGYPPGDRRLLVSSGPFNMMPGDTQEVVIAEIVAGDQNFYQHLAGVSLLKADAQFIRNYYPDKLYAIKKPSAPELSGTGLDREVVLNWGGNYSSIKEYENYNEGGFQFEGYKIYQLPYQNAALDEGKVIARVDKIDGIKNIVSNYVDPVSGQNFKRIGFNGGDTGLKYTLDLKRDSLTGGWLNDGTKYYFTVTGNFYNPEPGLIPNYFESSYGVITVIPKTGRPGVRYEGQIGQILEVKRTKGNAQNTINAVVTDPASLTGHTYRIDFDSTASRLVWNLTDVTSGEKKINHAELNDSLLVVDGIEYSIRPIVTGFMPPNGGIFETEYAGRPVETDAAGAPFGGNDVWHSLSSFQSDRYYLSAGGGDGDFDRLIRYPGLIESRDFEIRFTDGPNFGVKGFTSDSIITLPFQIWDIGVGTPDDNSDDRQMIPFIYENKPGYNTLQFDGDTDPVFGYPASDWIFFADPAQKDGYDKFAAECQKFGGAGGLYLPGSDGSPNGYWADLHGNKEFPISGLIFCDFSGSGQWPPSGTVIKFYSGKTYSSADVFEVKSPGITENESLAKKDVKAINVFPNPYYGANPNETGKYDRFVTFNHLPQRAVIRIFNLAGGMVKRIDKNDPSQFINWNLLNEGNYQVGSGLYIVYIEMPDLGVTKILKLSVIQPEIIPDHF